MFGFLKRIVILTSVFCIFSESSFSAMKPNDEKNGNCVQELFGKTATFSWIGMG